MIDAQNTKSGIMVAPQTIGTDAVTGYIDTLGYDHLRVKYIGAAAAAGDVLTTLKITESDTTENFADITGGAPGTIPAPNTSTGDIIEFDVNLAKSRKRYVGINIVGDATARNTAVIGVLSRAAVTPATDAESGAAEIVYV